MSNCEQLNPYILLAVKMRKLQCQAIHYSKMAALGQKETTDETASEPAKTMHSHLDPDSFCVRKQLPTPFN